MCHKVKDRKKIKQNYSITWGNRGILGVGATYRNLNPIKFSTVYYSYLGTLTTHFYIKLENLIIRKHCCTISYLFAENLHLQGEHENGRFLFSILFLQSSLIKGNFILIKKCLCLLTNLFCFKYLNSGQSLVWYFSTRSETLKTWGPR